MKCSKCGTQNREGRRFCAECGNKLGWKCPKCGFENEASEKFCGKCGVRFTEENVSPNAAIPKLEDMHAQLQSMIPDVLAQKYLAAEQQITGENRPITALFADISGSTQLASTRTSEAMFQLVQDCFKELVGIIASYEGRISGFRGDGLLALFGAPILHENDVERAILAALEMHHAMEKQQLRVTIGINTALMTVGEIQTQLYSEYTAYGTDIVLARRLQESAQPGQILVGAGTYRLTRRAFDFEALTHINMKGFSLPVPAYVVKQVKAHPEKLRGIEGLRARMIGREHEFTELKEATDEWLGGHGQIVSIIGEAGIGKSRLVQELREYLEEKAGKPEDQKAGVLVMEGRCVSIGQPISYWPFIDILKTYFNLSEGDDTANIARKVTDSIIQLMPQGADETLPLLGQLMSIKYGNELDDRLKFATPEQIRHQTLMRLRDIFATLARQKPLLLILEDLHWSDELSLSLISLLMDELANTPLMLLCIHRPDKEHQVSHLSDQAQRKCLDRYTEIILRKLSTVESRQLVEELLTIDNLPENIKNLILTKSEGNPFFIEEVIRSLIDRDLVYREGEHWKARDEASSIDVPDTIQSIILSRVDRLQAEAKYVLQCASVIGRLFKYRLLEHLSHQERNLNIYLSEFEERDLVYPEHTLPELEYAFKHALTQEATYHSILERKRREFHLQVAQGIERLYQERIEEFYEELAQHYSKSDNAEKAVKYLLKAGNKAKDNYANESAISYYQQALDMMKRHGLKRDDWHLAALCGLEGVYSLTGNFAAENVAKDAIELAKGMKLPHRQFAKLYARLSSAVGIQGRLKEGVRYAEMGLSILGEDTRCMEAAIIYGQIAVNYAFQGNVDKYWEYTQKHIPFIRELPYSKELCSCYVHIIENSATHISLDRAWQWSEELEKQAVRNHDLRGLSYAYAEKAIILSSKGDYKNVLLFTKKGHDIASRAGHNRLVDESCQMIMKALLIMGNIEEAKLYAETLKNIIDRAGPDDMLVYIRSLGDFEMSQRHWKQAISYYQKSLEKAQSSEAPVTITYSLLPLGKALVRKGDYELSFNPLQETIHRTLTAADYTRLRKTLAPSFLAQALREMEVAYTALGTPEKFVSFCQHIREQYKEAIESLSMGQLFLNSAQPLEDFFHSAFADDFGTEPIDPSWNWLDQFADCAHKISEPGVMEICAANGRDLDKLNVSAPRFIRDALGDFAIEVSISPASEEKPHIGGLLVWKDEKNFIRFDEGVDGENGIRLHGYKDGKLKIAGRGILHGNSKETHLRLERSGDEFSAYCSTDGENWFPCGKMTLLMEDPIQVGIHAIGMIDRTIYCGEYKEGTATLFRNFRIWTRE